MNQHPEDKLQAGEIRFHGKFFTWLENFWYHYKWHTLFGLFAFVVILVCVLQACGREDYDYLIAYAGDHHVFREDEAVMEQSLGAFAAGEGKSPKKVAITSYSTTYSEIKQLEQVIMTGDTVLYLMDAEVFSDVRGEFFMNIRESFPEIPEEMLTEDGYGVYLRATALYALDGFSGLPEDTVIGIQVARAYSSSRTRRNLDQCLALLREITAADVGAE